VYHWSECINIWQITSFGHSLIEEYIWQNPGERYRPIEPLVVYTFIATTFQHHLMNHWYECINILHLSGN